ncbi:MAG: aminopeptidase, partial [Betaproteobacteria bacterium PRO3]|nr:aminopeptidase [Betaproteobacteria bacterium PRO3]
VGEARDALAAAYASERSDDAKREAKRAIIGAMRAAWERTRSADPALAGYDRWFSGDDGSGPNNASLASVGLYTALVPAFRALLASEGGDLARFYARVRELAAQPKGERHAALGSPGAQPDPRP